MSAVAATATEVVLDVRDLTVEFARAGREPIRPVRGVSFTVERAQRLGIVGESGSGKSLTALSLMRLLPPAARLASGEVLLAGRPLSALEEREMARVRGGQMAIVYQDPMSSLNPLHSVGRQVIEAIRAHERVDRREARDRAIELLRDVGLPQPERRLDDYPHEFSGGMRQRVMIAMAICANPDVLIADEPTTALDVTTQARIMDILTRLVEERRMAVLLITHDLGLAASFCDDVHVMYGGRIVERGLGAEVFRAPVHPYTEALLESICRLDRPLDEPITAIGGQPPLPQFLPAGCSFHPRCPIAGEICREQTPPTVAFEGGSMAECHFALERREARR
ncbi:MAG TPA: ABC transporter ATP-binding protein [Gaiellaceae bacterium]|nr:ABC transporter ATP-binding protein [Gaiellaceae bacterium]